jgi:guanidinoacetate N-methyltransferase
MQANPFRDDPDFLDRSAHGLTDREGVHRPVILEGHNEVAERTLREQLSGMYSKIGFHPREAWKNAPAVFGDHTLKILDHPVMEDWERPYMAALAEIAATGGGSILEVGFGMGMSSSCISATPGVTTHVIIEANRDVAVRARAFAAEVRSHNCRVLEGFWEDVIDQIPDDSVDGILFDAYPLDESEVMNQAHFASTAYRKLRPGGRFTYFSDEISAYRPEHVKTLIAAGFSEVNISARIVAVEPPADCTYWKSNTILAPILLK